MKKSAFTLAEVLITLGVIGVVAALTMPSLITKYKEKETVVKLKKFYSIISQAYLRAVQENGTPDNWGITGMNADSSTIVAQMIKPYLVLSKDCAYNAGCFPDKYVQIDGVTNAANFLTGPWRYMVALSDGSSIAFAAASPDTIVIYYDINGSKPPNQFGKDMFQLSASFDKVESGLEGTDILTQCLKTGYTCFGWVVTNENMDYLRCPDKLDWDTKNKCD